MADETAYTLFPTDAPKTAPDWYQAQQTSAAARLSGNHGQQDDAAAQQAATIFSDDAPGAQRKDDSGKLFSSEDDDHFDAAPIHNFMSGFASSAAADGDIQRSHELQAAGEALAADFKAAGTDAGDVAEVLDIIRERQADTMMGPISPERAAAETEATMAMLTAEGVTEQDLNLARKFLQDVELLAPGTLRSLDATGAGSDPRIIRKVIAESRRRGYR